MTEPAGTSPDLLRRLAALDPGRRALLAERLRAQDQARVGRPARSVDREPRRSRRPGTTMDFSLFFFSGDGSSAGPDKYRLLLDSARFADRNGFSGIWIPERHFVDFGGLYPNPSVLAAAVAMVTERIQIRAGSVVLPLHHPARVAEEWAVVDNLSGGRVAISAASGWHPSDFLLAPGDGAAAYERRKDELFAAMDTVQRLWSGEEVPLTGTDGRPRPVRTRPRPLQPRLPMWVSAQGNPDTFARAGRAGANLLTGLLGHGPAGLGEKVTAYRAARRKAGHEPAGGRVTVMLHTFLGTNQDQVEALVRAPLTEYLGTFLAQQDSFGGPFAQLPEAERAAVLAAAFDRYVDAQALLGTPDSAEAVVEDMVDAGVDEVACLIDFGVDPDRVLGGLEQLRELAGRYRPREGHPA